MKIKASPDVTTPIQYTSFSSGFINYLDDGRGLLTKGGRESYNALIDKYKLQFKDIYLIELSKDLGVLPYTDTYGNKIYVIDQQRLKYLLILKAWNRDQRDPDSIWLKIRNKILP